MELIQEKLALKELVDVFSNLADAKDTAAQAQLFTEDAVLESYINGELTSKQVGRTEIKKACAGFLALFDTVYHVNGQQVVEVDGNTATGIAYCQVVLIGENGGKRIMNTQGVRYQDTYTKLDGKWLIQVRKSDFVWSDSKVDK